MFGLKFRTREANLLETLGPSSSKQHCPESAIYTILETMFSARNEAPTQFIWTESFYLENPLTNNRRGQTTKTFPTCNNSWKRGTGETKSKRRTKTKKYAEIPKITFLNNESGKMSDQS